MTTPLIPTQWANLDFLVIQNDPQYIPDPDNPGGLLVQPGWFEITTTEQLAEVEQQIADLTPVPPPVPNIANFQRECKESYKVLMRYAFAKDAGDASALSNMVARLNTELLPEFVTDWNEIFEDANLDSNIPINVTNAAANNHIPLVMNTDFTLSIVM